MSAQFKLDQKPKPDQVTKISGNEIIKQRPNIDHLLKRINTERRQERKSTLVIIIIAVIGISVSSYIFTQA